jgi:hypothetical protein
MNRDSLPVAKDHTEFGDPKRTWLISLVLEERLQWQMGKHDKHNSEYARVDNRPVTP